MPQSPEYALGSNPSSPSSPPTGAIASLAVNGTTGNYLTVTLNRLVSATGIVFHVEHSSDLVTWDETTVLVSSSSNLDGTATEIWRSPAAIGSTSRDFLRLRVTMP